jgi:8-oxo-dGTP pyrophosphatase MutT (NUDIX family)/phosphohistidine phosphatase SixA
MPDRRAADEQRAAGAVVWRSAGSGSQVGLVHRPKYDDWSFPKGKLEPDEHVLLAAVREVAEETALQVTLGRRLPPVRYVNDGVPKRVDYWVATVERALAGFEANSEIDEIAWLAAAQASERLSYSRDVETLGDFRGGPRQTAPLILVRHASAGSKSGWAGSDASRPLDSRGKNDASALASLLRCFGVCRVISAPAERCVATMRPYAAATGGVIEIESAFDVVNGAGSGPDESAVTAMAQLAADSRPVIVCAHRENLPVLLDAACATLGGGRPGGSGGRSRARGPGGKPLRKGEFVVLHRAEGKLIVAERHHPDRTLLVRAAR